jgi:hypothetical protein
MALSVNAEPPISLKEMRMVLCSVALKSSAS